MECNFKGMTLCNLTSFYENTSLTFVHISMQTSKARAEAPTPIAALTGTGILQRQNFLFGNLLAALNSCSLTKISLTS